MVVIQLQLEQVDQAVHGQVVVEQEAQLLKDQIQFLTQLHHQVVVEVDLEIILPLLDHLEDQVVVEVELIMLPQTEEMVILEDLVFQKEVLVDKLVNLHLDLMQQELVVVEQQRLELQVQHLQVVDQELEEQVLLIQLQDLM
jgi:hypothetical protein